MIWVYGCQESPYLLPIFLTPRAFSLEFIKQIIISKTEHFLKLNKSSNLNFSFIIGLFIVKSRSCLSQVQANIKEFGFAQLQGRRYDPHQIISKRRLLGFTAWKNQVKRLESEGPQGVKSSLDEKDKLIQSLKKKVKMSPERIHKQQNWFL